jgi:hypothetical protein
VTVNGEERNYVKYDRKPYKTKSKPKCLTCDGTMISLTHHSNGQYNKLGFVCPLCKYIYIFKRGYKTFRVDWRKSTTGEDLGND